MFQNFMAMQKPRDLLIVQYFCNFCGFSSCPIWWICSFFKLSVYRRLPHSNISSIFSVVHLFGCFKMEKQYAATDIHIPWQFLTHSGKLGSPKMLIKPSGCIYMFWGRRYEVYFYPIIYSHKVNMANSWESSWQDKLVLMEVKTIFLGWYQLLRIARYLFIFE